mgnify:CR=1 FL=1
MQYQAVLLLCDSPSLQLARQMVTWGWAMSNSRREQQNEASMCSQATQFPEHSAPFTTCAKRRRAGCFALHWLC